MLLSGIVAVEFSALKDAIYAIYPVFHAFLFLFPFFIFPFFSQRPTPPPPPPYPIILVNKYPSVLFKHNLAELVINLVVVHLVQKL